MLKEMYGKKIGMTQIFDEEANAVPVTLIGVEPAYILEKKPGAENKVRIGCFELAETQHKKIRKPQLGYFRSLKTAAYRMIREVEADEGIDKVFSPGQETPSQTEEPASPDESADTQAEEKDSKPAAAETHKQGAEEKAGDENTKSEEKIPEEKTDDSPESAPAEDTENKTEKDASSPETQNPGEHKGEAQKSGPAADSRRIGAEIFQENDIIDVRAKTKGRGFSGGMRRHGWSGQPKSHGSTTHRRIGSVGASADPSKIIKGLNMPGQYGNTYRTTKNLTILKIDPEKGLIFVKGAVPGPKGTLVRITRRKTVKTKATS
ncbi:MAG: 50S ribosomal protein L3 [Candidatus Omnitrophica bacterium]|nr:50S ribosomal protein L3 [Candidatus Omnitrophota bacterium]